LPDIRKFLEAKLKDADMTMTMKWGKYKGKSIKWIHDSERSYFGWLLSNKNVDDNCPALRNALMEHEKNDQSLARKN